MTITERAKSLGISPATIYNRVSQLGWSVWEALSITKEQARKRFNEKKCHYWAFGKPIRYQVKKENYQCAIDRIKAGMSPREAVRLQDYRSRNSVKYYYDKSNKCVSLTRATQRVYHGWGLDEACNTPLIKSRWERYKNEQHKIHS